MTRPLLTYICVAPADEIWLKDLEIHLASSAKQGLVRPWSESQIQAGDLRQAEIDRQLERADIVLLLVSPGFLASQHCSEITERALLRVAAGRSIVIPVLLKPCLWETAPFGNLQPLPGNRKPITGWADRDDAWLHVVQGIRQVAERLHQTAAPTPELKAGPTPTEAHAPERSPGPPGNSAKLPAASVGPVPLFAWIHVSDLHFGHGDAAHGWDQVLVTNTLRADIQILLGKGIPAPDAILVTGDVAFSGDTRLRPGGRPSQEYGDAKHFLLNLGGAARLGPQQIFVIPGNHDVQRSADQDRGLRRLIGTLRSGSEPLDDALAHPPDRALLARRQANYLRFAADFAPAVLGPAAPPEERLWWWHQLDTPGGLAVRLIGLNTALLAADDQDLGKLQLGKEVLAQVLATQPSQANELLIVMTHHPLRGGWLADQKDADGWIRSKAHIHLCGHVHEAESEEGRSGAAGNFVRVVSGAGHGEPGAEGAQSHGYNVAAVMAWPDGTLTLRIWPRRWSDKTKEFRSDVANLPDGQQYAEHLLRLRLPGTARLPAWINQPPL